MRVLWLEDEFDDVPFYSGPVDAMVTGRGGSVSYCVTVAEALRKVAAEEFDVVILDLNVPLGDDAPPELKDGELNGVHVVDYLRSHDRLKRTRVVCLTNFSERARAVLGDEPRIFILRKGSYVAELQKAVFNGCT